MDFAEHTKIRKEKFGSVVFDTLTEKIFITDDVGGEILQLIEQGKTLSEITALLADRYDQDRKIIEQDVTEFVGTLKTNKIIAT